jgi:hypothetical protein
MNTMEWTLADLELHVIEDVPGVAVEGDSIEAVQGEGDDDVSWTTEAGVTLDMATVHDGLGELWAWAGEL